MISWNGPRHGPRDDGTVSYYQYETELASMPAIQRAVLEKPAVQACAYLATLRSIVDEEDARTWGGWFAGRIAEWLRRFSAAPETLETWAWRVLWRKQ